MSVARVVLGSNIAVEVLVRGLAIVIVVVVIIVVVIVPVVIVV